MIKLKNRKSNLASKFYEEGLGPLDLPQFTNYWSNFHPIDRMWRTKYNIPFNSEQHRNTPVVDILIDIYQDTYIDRVIAQLAETKSESKYVPGYGKYFKTKRTVELTETEIDTAFDNIEFDNIQADEDGTYTL